MFVQQPDDEVCVITKFGLIDECHAVRTGTELAGNVSLAWQVWMQNVIGVRSDATEYLVIRRAEQVVNGG